MWIPSHRNDADVASQDWMVQLMSDHTTLVHIPKKCLQGGGRGKSREPPRYVPAPPLYTNKQASKQANNLDVIMRSQGEERARAKEQKQWSYLSIRALQRGLVQSQRLQQNRGGSGCRAGKDHCLTPWRKKYLDSSLYDMFPTHPGELKTPHTSTISTHTNS